MVKIAFLVGQKKVSRSAILLGPVTRCRVTTVTLGKCFTRGVALLSESCHVVQLNGIAFT